MAAFSGPGREVDIDVLRADADSVTASVVLQAADTRSDVIARLAASVGMPAAALRFHFQFGYRFRAAAAAGAGGRHVHAVQTRGGFTDAEGTTRREAELTIRALTLDPLFEEYRVGWRGAAVPVVTVFPDCRFYAADADEPRAVAELPHGPDSLRDPAFVAMVAGGHYFDPDARRPPIAVALMRGAVVDIVAGREFADRAEVRRQFPEPDAVRCAPLLLLLRSGDRVPRPGLELEAFLATREGVSVTFADETVHATWSESPPSQRWIMDGKTFAEKLESCLDK